MTKVLKDNHVFKIGDYVILQCDYHLINMIIPKNTIGVVSDISINKNKMIIEFSKSPSTVIKIHKDGIFNGAGESVNNYLKNFFKDFLNNYFLNVFI